MSTPPKSSVGVMKTAGLPNMASPQLSMRYIGSKTRVVSEIMKLLGPPIDGGTFVDAFCGTGSVSRAASDAGWPVRINDHLRCAVTVATAGLINFGTDSFAGLGGYSEVLQILNSLQPREGFIWSEYSPASLLYGQERIERRYFNESNAKRIDAIRTQIAEWKNDGLISESEETVLLADLLLASNRVANISGTYGCFLRSWQSSALKPIELRPREFSKRVEDAISSCLDVYELVTRPNDVVYLDPPYTKRQYAAYYHILETICVGDQPLVTGKTGLRPWKHLASVFCYKRHALEALTSLILNQPARRVLLSYSNEGHVDLHELTNRLRPFRSVEIHQIATVGRYRPNQVASSKSKEVVEYLLDIQVNSLQTFF